MCCLCLYIIVLFLVPSYMLADSSKDKFSAKWKTDFLSNSNNLYLKNIDNVELCFPHQYKDYKHNVEKRDLSTKTDGIHNASTYFSLEFENQTYIIDLALNQELLPDSFAVTTYTQAGYPQVHRPSENEKNHCYYQGHVRGIIGSKVIADTCDGLRGCIILPNDFLLIEPLKDGAHAIYRPKDAVSNEEIKVFAYDNVTNRKNVIFHNHTLFYAEIVKFRDAFMKQSAKSEKKFVELMIVADYATYKKYSTKAAVESHVKEVMNYVDGFYREIDIRVILSHIEVWNNGDRFPISSDAEAVLEGLSRYRVDQLKSEPSSSPWVYTDTVHLLHGGDFEGNTLGVAYVGAMCRRNSVGIDQDNRLAINVASTISHEMGHSFGMEHDGEDCKCPEGKECIMSASTSFSKPMTWSSCSEVALQQNLNLGIGNCLYNVPHSSQIVGGQQCGNDIVEQGEECDCGYPDQCESSCCNPSTCRLVSGAICDAGICCNDCQLVEVGVSCRESANECDLPEYCSGDSPYCPDNVYKEDGTRCLGDSAACSGGVCLTLDMLCATTWGEGATKAEDICYNVVNIMGIQHGNCGHDENGNLIKCAAENVNCGTLFCSGGRDLPMIGNLAVTVTISEKHRCKAVGTSSNKSDTMDPGLVRTGTTCGPGKACLDEMCQNIPALSCTEKCNRNGICNNFENCHCNDGFAAPYCNESGKGGSIDSGLYVRETSTGAGNVDSAQSAATKTDNPLNAEIAATTTSGNPDDDSSEHNIAEIALIVMSVIAAISIIALGIVVSLRVYNATIKYSSRYVKEETNAGSSRSKKILNPRKFSEKKNKLSHTEDFTTITVNSVVSRPGNNRPAGYATKYAPTGTGKDNRPIDKASDNGTINASNTTSVANKRSNNKVIVNRSRENPRKNIEAGSSNRRINRATGNRPKRNAAKDASFDKTTNRKRDNFQGF